MLTSVLGRTVLAERYGTAPGSVLALHGWGRTRADFAPVLEGLDALAVDLPGFGTTPAPDTAWSTAEYAAHLAPLLREMDRPVVVGHSFGGRVAVHLAATHPDALRGVVFTGAPLVRPPSSGGGPAPAYRLVRALRRAGLVSEERLEAARRRHGSADYRAATGVLREVLVKAVTEDYGAPLAAMGAAHVPARFVCGEHDTAAPPAQAAEAAERVGAPAPAVVAGSGHLLDAALAREVRAAVDALLAGGAR